MQAHFWSMNSLPEASQKLCLHFAIITTPGSKGYSVLIVLYQSGTSL